MTVASPLAAAILIGGQARRMGGADKSALLVGGVPILDRQLAALRDVTRAVFLVGDRPSHSLPAGLRIVPDRFPGAGALGGIFTAIVESPFDRTLVLGCDMPFVTPQLVERLAAEDADVVIPRTDRGYEPLCAIYTKACTERIRERIEHGELQASVLPAGVRVVELGPDVLATIDPGGWMLANVNTPGDHERARSHADRIRDTGKGKEQG